MSNIERFGQLGGMMGKEPSYGDWVRYYDHVAAVTRLNDEIARVNLRVDEEAETDRIAAERNAARAEVERLEAEVDRLTVERDAAYISIEALRNALAEQDHELDMAREDVLRLTTERDAARAEVERLKAMLPPTAHTGVRNGPGEGSWSVFAEKVVEERDAAQAEVERLTVERDTARAEVRRLIAERDQPESRGKGREVGRFGLDGHYLYAMEPARPSDEDIWREVFLRCVSDYMTEDRRVIVADTMLAEYRKRWPR